MSGGPRSRVHPDSVPPAPGGSPGRRPHLPIEPSSQDRTQKVYLLVRSDLSPGQQITQAAHALSMLPAHAPDVFDRWREVSDSLIVLAVRDEIHLSDLCARLRRDGVGFVSWREPDLGDETTAVVVEPSELTPVLLGDLPLAGRDPAPAGAVSREASMRRLSTAMQECEQTSGMNLLEHGRAVRETYLALLDFAGGGADPDAERGWRLPAWLLERGAELTAAQVPVVTAERYLTLHDCGKPDVRTVGDDGSVRFPGHAEASVRRYRRTTRSHADPMVAELIGLDMAVHVGSADAMQSLAEHPGSATLLLAAVAEVHANAAMFGGVESASFKGKIKKVDQRGRALIRHWDEHGWPRPYAAG